MITVSGTLIPTPSEFSVTLEDISKAERNASAEILIERIATKRKLEISYLYLSNADTAALLTLVGTSAVFFTVVYPDPATGADRSGTFYCGSRTAGTMEFRNSTIKYKDVKFNLIEK